MNAMTVLLRSAEPVEISTSAGTLLTDPEAPVLRVASEALEARLLAAPAGTVVPVSLKGTTLVASCLAALLTPVLTAIATGRIRDRYIVVWDPDERNEWDADAALKKQSSRLGTKLVCVWRSGGRVNIVGPVDEQVNGTYKFSLSYKEGVTSRQLAEAAGITIQAASNRLAKAAAQGLVYRGDQESVPGGGVQHLFVPVK
jgi:hypothetical protein